MVNGCLINLSINEFCRLMDNGVKRYSFQFNNKNYVCNLNHSKRLQVLRKNLNCVVCGLNTNLIRIEKNSHYSHPPSPSKFRNCFIQDCSWCYHYNKRVDYRKSNTNAVISLYHQKVNGKLIEITQDHIIPLSRGGSKSRKNLQTMCFDCNQKKGNFYV